MSEPDNGGLLGNAEWIEQHFARRDAIEKAAVHWGELVERLDAAAVASLMVPVNTAIH